MTADEEKAKFRCEIRARKRQFPDGYLAKAGQAITEKLLALPAYREAETVFCFVGVSGEIDTRAILADALLCGKRVCVPRCVGDGEMELRQIDALSQLSPGAFGIPEPSDAAPLLALDAVRLALIPCLCCTKSGDRLGKGGGYYDRFLARYAHTAMLLCPERLVVGAVPLAPHDRRIPLVLTENGLYTNGITV